MLFYKLKLKVLHLLTKYIVMQYLKNHLFISFLFIFLVFSEGFSQKEIGYQIDITGNYSTKKNLPFWMTANKFGVVPNENNAILHTAIFSNYSKHYKTLDFAFKASGVGFIADKNDAFIDELYAAIKYKNLFELEIGIKNDDIIFEGLSSSNGNILKSGNARAYPGVNFKTVDFITLPFAKKWLRAKFNYVEYLLNDKRYIDNTRLHHKSLHFKFLLNKKVDIVAGLDHYVQWGGTKPNGTKQPSGFKNYLKIITGASGGSDASISDQINALGNHIGAYKVQLNYKGNTNYSFYISHPFEDSSGRELHNIIDNIYGVFIDFNRNKSLLSHLLVEVTHTKHMSGRTPHSKDKDGTIIPASGRDNYFNNSPYTSGWTFYGNTIGSPYFTPNPKNKDGITPGVKLGDNRFTAFNLGLQGNITTLLKYKTKLSYVQYYGWFGEEYKKKPHQFSGYFEFYVPEFTLPFEVSFGAAFDLGNYSKDVGGGFLKLTKRGLF